MPTSTPLISSIVLRSAFETRSSVVSRRRVWPRSKRLNARVWRIVMLAVTPRNVTPRSTVNNSTAPGGSAEVAASIRREPAMVATAAPSAQREKCRPIHMMGKTQKKPSGRIEDAAIKPTATMSAKGMTSGNHRGIRAQGVTRVTAVARMTIATPVSMSHDVNSSGS